MPRSKVVSEGFLIKERRRENLEKMELYPPDAIYPEPVNWVKLGIIAIMIILIISIGRRAYDLSEDIQDIDNQIEKEAQDCLKQFSKLGCPVDNVSSNEGCQNLYACARKTKSAEHIQAFLEKAAYMAIFEVSTEAVGPIVVVAIFVAFKIAQKLRI